MVDGYTVFRINDYDWYSGVRLDTKFYYFADAKLVQIDGGQLKQKRHQVEIINNCSTA